MRASPTTSAPLRDPPSIPAWAIPRGPATNDAEAAFMAGAALNCLDNLVRAEPAWAGAWRGRLALQCAAAALAQAGRAEDEAALRDAWHLRRPGDAPGPAGDVLLAWRRMAARSPAFQADVIGSTADLLGLRQSESLVELAARVEMLAQSADPAPVIAAAVARDVMARRPDAGPLAWLLADEALARRMRWPLPVPLLMAQARGPAFASADGRGRARPGAAGFERAVFSAVALGAAQACRHAAGMAARAARLAAVAPTLRARGAGEAIALLLEDDAVSGTLQTRSLSRWASRRLFERLETLGAVRELSGRPMFRLYGL